MKKWDQSSLEDLRLWALSSRLPPGFSMEALVEVVELAICGLEQEDLREKLEESEREREALERELGQLYGDHL